MSLLKLRLIKSFKLKLLAFFIIFSKSSAHEWSLITCQCSNRSVFCKHPATQLPILVHYVYTIFVCLDLKRYACWRWRMKRSGRWESCNKLTDVTKWWPQSTKVNQHLHASGSVPDASNVCMQRGLYAIHPPENPCLHFHWYPLAAKRGPDKCMDCESRVHIFEHCLRFFKWLT